MEKMKGTLYVISTPIGNLEDITFRAVKILKEVDVIACENIPNHLKLLNYYGIKGKKIIKVTSANEQNSLKGIIKLLNEGKNVGLVSDAGTPTISDPGKLIVSGVLKNGFKVVPVPGPSALTTALSVSPIPTDKFIFLGFSPKSIKKTIKILEEFGFLDIPVVLFFPPRDIEEFLKSISETFPNSEIAIFRELTKINEEIIYSKVEEIQLNEKLTKGEMVIILKISKKSK